MSQVQDFRIDAWHPLRREPALDLYEGPPRETRVLGKCLANSVRRTCRTLPTGQLSNQSNNAVPVFMVVNPD